MIEEPSQVDLQQTPCRLERLGRKNGAYFSATELMDMVFPEPRWAVPGLVAEGLNLLVGAPKLGKSWFCLGLAIAVASGSVALGNIPVQEGAVLYAALEDPPRRLQDRMDRVLGASRLPANLFITTQLPRMPEAIEWLEGWLRQHQDARLVIIDVLRKIRPTGDGRGKGNAYNEDYDTMCTLKELADQYGVALIVVHHTRKATDDKDVFNEVSGSTGLTGAADAILILKRSRKALDAELHITGREVIEQEYGLAWSDKTCTWQLLDGPAAADPMPQCQRTIYEHLRHVTRDTPKGIFEATGVPKGTIKSALSRMTARGSIKSDGHGTYFVVEPGTDETMEPPVPVKVPGFQVPEPDV